MQSCSTLPLALFLVAPALAQCPRGSIVPDHQPSHQDYLGLTVDVEGPIGVVGARGDDESIYNGGAVYVFDPADGSIVHKLFPHDPVSGKGFGSVVALSGTTALVAADFDQEAGFNAGAVYVFDATTGLEIAKWLPTESYGNHAFGEDLDAKGGLALVGAKGDHDVAQHAGAAYVIDVATGDPAPQADGEQRGKERRLWRRRCSERELRGDRRALRGPRRFLDRQRVRVRRGDRPRALRDQRRRSGRQRLPRAVHRRGRGPRSRGEPGAGSGHRPGDGQCARDPRRSGQPADRGTGRLVTPLWFAVRGRLRRQQWLRAVDRLGHWRRRRLVRPSLGGLGRRVRQCPRHRRRPGLHRLPARRDDRP